MVRLPLWCLLWGCLLTSVHPEPPTPCRQDQYYVNNQCCDLCQAGTRLVNDCSEGLGTECRPCQDDEFQDHPNRERRCHSHKYCDPHLGLKIQKKGTVSTDTICTCEEDKHCTTDACESCTPHKACHPGFGVHQRGTGTSDTICKPCPYGYFSNVSSTYEACHPWSRCEFREVRAGTSSSDVLCGPLPRLRVLVAIPIIVGVLFVVLLVFIFISRMVKKPNNKDPPGQDAKKSPEETVFIGYITANTTAPVQETLQGCQPVAQEDGKESRISVQERL